MCIDPTMIISGIDRLDTEGEVNNLRKSDIND